VAALTFAFSVELLVIKREFLVRTKRAFLHVVLASQRGLFLSAFVISLGLRLLLLLENQPSASQIDLSLYVSVGRLVAGGIDPYDYGDGIVEREVAG
jgi:hypothetical protein